MLLFVFFPNAESILYCVELPIVYAILCWVKCLRNAVGGVGLFKLLWNIPVPYSAELHLETWKNRLRSLEWNY